MNHATKLPDMDSINRFCLHPFLEPGQAGPTYQLQEPVTHECQIALVQLLKKVRLLER